jgi:preprotein translocase subunit SecG
MSSYFELIVSGENMKRFSMVLGTMFLMAAIGQAIASPHLPAKANGRVMVLEFCGCLADVRLNL